MMKEWRQREAARAAEVNKASITGKVVLKKNKMMTTEVKWPMAVEGKRRPVFVLENLRGFRQRCKGPQWLHSVDPHANSHPRVMRA